MAMGTGFSHLRSPSSAPGMASISETLFSLLSLLLPPQQVLEPGGVNLSCLLAAEETEARDGQGLNSITWCLDARPRPGPHPWPGAARATPSSSMFFNCLSPGRLQPKWSQATGTAPQGSRGWKRGLRGRAWEGLGWGVRSGRRPALIGTRWQH